MGNENIKLRFPFHKVHLHNDSLNAH